MSKKGTVWKTKELMEEKYLTRLGKAGCTGDNFQWTVFHKT
jgi:hypothetical protein